MSDNSTVERVADRIVANAKQRMVVYDIRDYVHIEKIEDE